jgi:lipopolysaccharide export system permease protein
MKLPRLSIIDRYIIRKFLGTFFYAIIIIIAISCIFDLSEHIDDYFEHKSTFKDVVVHYYLNFIPYFTIIFSPLIVFISVIYFTSRMAYSMEIIALLSNGMSFNRLLRPYILAAFVIALMTFTINSFILPYANIIRNEFMDRTFRTGPKNYNERNIHKQIMPGVYIYMESYSISSNTGFKFSIEKFDEGKLVSKLISEYVQWDSTKSKWRMRNYYMRTYIGLKEIVKEGTVLDTALNMRPGDFAVRDDSFYETMTMRKLNNYISALKMQGAETVTFYLVEKHKRLAFPFSTFILTLIGVTLSSKKIKGGIGMHIGAGLGLSFSYIFFMQFSSQFAINGSLPPMLAAWTPNLIFGIIVIVLYRIAPK